MKKFLLTTILFTALSCLNANAMSQVVIDYQGETVVRQNTVERNLLVNCAGDGVYNIAVKPLDDALRSADGSVEIPLEYVYLNNNREDVYLRFNDYSRLFEGLQMNGVPHQLTAKVRGYGMVPAGIYNLNFEIQATNTTDIEPLSTSSFNLQFIVPAHHEVTLHEKTSKITVKASDALNKAKKVTNETSPMLYINSNCDWILYMNTDNFEAGKGKMYVRTVSSSPSIKERLQERVLLEPNKEIILARGKAPSDNQFVTIEYSVENEDKGFLKAGEFQNRVKYVIREDRR